MVLSVFDQDFKEQVSQGLVFVDFWAPWCGPCRMQGPVIDALDEEIGDQVKFVKVDVDQAQETARDFRIMSIPTMMLFKDGQPVETLVGLHSQDQLEAVLDKYLG